MWRLFFHLKLTLTARSSNAEIIFSEGSYCALIAWLFFFPFFSPLPPLLSVMQRPALELQTLSAEMPEKQNITTSHHMFSD